MNLCGLFYLNSSGFVEFTKPNIMFKYAGATASSIYPRFPSLVPAIRGFKNYLKFTEWKTSKSQRTWNVRPNIWFEKICFPWNKFVYNGCRNNRMNNCDCNLIKFRNWPPGARATARPNQMRNSILSNFRWINFFYIFYSNNTAHKIYELWIRNTILSSPGLFGPTTRSLHLPTPLTLFEAFLVLHICMYGIFNTGAHSSFLLFFVGQGYLERPKIAAEHAILAHDCTPK